MILIDLDLAEARAQGDERGPEQTYDYSYCFTRLTELSEVRLLEDQRFKRQRTFGQSCSGLRDF